MNYRHSFHAGNFADVFKHVVLTALVNSFFKKETPFCYLDTHAGAGIYDLQSKEALKGKEFENGILPLIDSSRKALGPKQSIENFIRCFRKLNSNQNLQYYPGSPEVVRQLLRPQDRIVLSELHPEEYISLKKQFPHHKQIAIHNQDGYLSLKAFLPPKEKRGLILIDPPYENIDEFEKLIEMVPQAIKRFETGVYAIWYPIKNRAPVDYFLRVMKEKISRPMLVTELSIQPEDLPTHLNGSGMLIINPPWKVEEELKEVLPTLWRILSKEEKGKWRVTHS